MDTRILIALGMLLATALAGLMKGALSGADLKEVLILVGGGIIGIAQALRTSAGVSPPVPPAKPPLPVPAIVLLLIGALFLAGCATVEGERRVSMGCADTLSQDCDDPTAYPPITNQLPQGPPGMRPFPRLIEEPQPATPQPETPAGRLLKKLGK